MVPVLMGFAFYGGGDMLKEQLVLGAMKTNRKASVRGNGGTRDIDVKTDGHKSLSLGGNAQTEV